MKLKDQVFDAIRPYAKHYRVFKVLSVLQLLLTMAIPVVWPDIDTAMWLLSFAFFCVLAVELFIASVGPLARSESERHTRLVNGVLGELVVSVLDCVGCFDRLLYSQNRTVHLAIRLTERLPPKK